MVVSIVKEISRLRQHSISYMTVGEITLEGRDLVFYLDNREVNRIYLPQLNGFSNNVYFNRNGITGGGQLVLKYKRTYRVVIEEVTGKIHIE